MSEKPPLGLMPRKLWDEQHPNSTREDRAERLLCITGAMQRYDAAGKKVPDEWVVEHFAVSREFQVMKWTNYTSEYTPFVPVPPTCPAGPMDLSEFAGKVQEFYRRLAGSIAQDADQPLIVEEK